jgi:tRNA(Ile)-lysidine synthase
MAPRRGTVVRPLLGLRRGDTVAVCEAVGLVPLRDPTNDDRTQRRSWLRHEVLPLLATGAERDLVPVLARQAEVLRAESEFLDDLARAAWPPDPRDPAPPAAPLAALTDVLARRAVRLWIGPPPPSFDEVERVRAVARGDIRATQLAGDRRVSRSGGRLRLTGGSVAG